MILYHHRNQCWGYEERKEELILTFTVTQYHNERNAALPDTTAKSIIDYSHRNWYGDYKLKSAQHLL